MMSGMEDVQLTSAVGARYRTACLGGGEEGALLEEESRWERSATVPEWQPAGRGSEVGGGRAGGRRAGAHVCCEKGDGGRVDGWNVTEGREKRIKEREGSGAGISKCGGKE